ncbi:putative isochorismatase family hydrolase [Sodiomyces alkalinus F11]|uniref:Putative isochorismatase family hydrolase n=1 Tax=Sodiomyces alkalinus (strain CBS 110278 / VKM F-3762 / F11) TaxID=1314773 RepID=A0A3N2Q3I7_SODAK|nr:putative isochorismatase family hydrolase [Sodiomyces alkalinus F11]ROT41320.1 putative isochorismatase family hydrolase [Sodiomyces alkalinus F11]
MKPASSTPTALVIIDVQQAFKHKTHWGASRSTINFETNVASLLQAARSYNTKVQSSQAADQRRHPILIVHVHHHSLITTSPLHPSYILSSSTGTGTTRGVEPTEYAAPAPGELVLTKCVNSAFVGTDLEARLRAFGARQLIAVGLTSDHCVNTTVRMAANLQVLGDDGGSDGTGEGNNGVVIVRDATATFAKPGFEAEVVHAVHLASLEGEFAAVKTAGEVIGEVMR